MKKILIFILLCALQAFAQAPKPQTSLGNVYKNYFIGNDSLAKLYIGYPLSYNTSGDTTKGIKLWDGDEMGSRTFVSGWQGGYGWKLGYADSEYTLNIDNLNVRGSLSAYELDLQQIKVTGGDLLVTDGSQVNYTGFNGSTYQYYFTTKSAIDSLSVSPFQANDIIICQQTSHGMSYDGNGDIVANQFLIKRLIYEVTSIDGLKVYYTTLSDAPANVGSIRIGDVFARIGNTSLSSGRNGTIGLFTTEQYSPYIRVTDSVNSWGSWKSLNNNKFQAGNLNGITDPAFPNIGGYGVYTRNFYSKDGNMVLSSGGVFRSGKTSFADSTDPGYLFTIANGQPQFVVGDANSYIKYGGDKIKIKGEFDVFSPTLTNKFNGINYTITNQGTQINVTLDSLRLLAYNQTWFNGRLSSDSATLVIMAGQISSKVSSTDYNGSTIASLINQTSHSIDMSALNINLSGAVTFSDFDGTTQGIINGKTSSSDVTTIVGGMITTSYINALGITANNIVANASITSPTITGDFYLKNILGSNVGSITSFSDLGTMVMQIQATSKIYIHGTNFTLDQNGYITNGIWQGSTISPSYLDLSGTVPTSRTVNGYSLSGNISLNNIAVGISNFGAKSGSLGVLAASSMNVYGITLTIGSKTVTLLCQ